MIFINFIPDHFTPVRSLEEKKLYKITVKGRVQGVGFRYSTLREARRLGICGFVRNMPDGTVYIEAEASSDVLKEFVKWCENGPGYVSSVNTSVYPPAGYSEFSIKH
ncbi:MAG: acylphosphatase [Bacteroidales bacterium]|nr:acylphosphatase [Bacteroidales bacterium]